MRSPGLDVVGNHRVWAILASLLVVLALGPAGILLSPSTVAAQPSVTADGLRRYYQKLPFPMTEVKLPRIPDRSFDIRQYGAVGDGRTANTRPFARALRACVKGGGGRVVVPPGMWLTGPIRLESKTELHLERGAVVVFSRNFEDFPVVRDPQEGSNRFRCTPPLWAIDAEDVAVTGSGIIDGSGDAWRPVKKEKLTENEWQELLSSGGVTTEDGKVWWPSEGALRGEGLVAELEKRANLGPKDFEPARQFLRANMVEFVRCKRVLLNGPTFQNSPRYAVNPVQCEDLVVCDVTIFNPPFAQNGDGLDLTACRRVLVVNSTVSAGDDAICLKPGKTAKWQASGPACEQIVIEGCTVYRGHGGFVIGSEGYGGARDIMVRNCAFIGTDVGLRFKSSRGRGGLVERIFVDGVKMKDIVGEAILFDAFYGSGPPEAILKSGTDSPAPRQADPRTPQFRDFTIRNITCASAGRALLFLGLPEMPIEGIRMEAVTIVAGRGGALSQVKDIELKDFAIIVAKGPVIDLREAYGVSLVRGVVPAGTQEFLSIAGKRSGAVRLVQTDLAGVKVPIMLGPGVPPGAVVSE